MLRWNVDLADERWQSDKTANKVSESLLAGELVAIPTETVYGLAADASNPVACAKIFAAKGRPQFNPLISHVASLDDALQHGHFNEAALETAKAFWPGPLTIVVPRKNSSSICDLATAGLPSVALRVPSGPVMRFLAKHTGRPLAAPSANISGKISTTTAAAVEHDLGTHLSYLVDAGPCSVGIESTIVAFVDDTPRLLRPGGLSRGAIESLLGRPLETAETVTQDAPQAPGMLTSHYAPEAGVRLNASHVNPGEALLAFGEQNLEGSEAACAVINLSKNANLVEAAARLFAAMRELDACGAASICVQGIPEVGLGEAINDRLRRAAAPRP
ncbi:MAG: threonylcarbamoyl-AMP synthase [Rhodobacteraceae bacterium]|nr:threonylcarbamoyl-AMP synthase [Paracoccaceae bacterium]